jgi:hypothetical protein
VVVAGDYAYVADWAGLVIIDITDKTDPKRVGGYDTSGWAYGVVVAGDYAFVADYDNGLVIIDITDKTDPKRVGGYDTSGDAYSVAVAGDYAYIADGSNGLVIIEIITEKPTAIIDNILPNPANEGEEVWFYGNGTDDGTITEYYWNSSIDGFLSHEKSFSLSNLSNGTHTIYFKVKDNNNTWSDEVSAILTINGIPKAKIDEIKSNPANEGKEVWFYGNGTDDGTIIAYSWRSDKDGNLSDKKSFEKSDLSVGVYTIYLKVQDNSGVWSNEVNTTLTINKKQIPIVKFTSVSNGTKIDKSKKTYTFNGTASDDIKVTKIQIKIDDGEWQDAEGTSDWSYNWNLTNVKIGNHTISVRAFDGSSYLEIETIYVNVVDGEEESDEGLNIIYIIPIIGIIAVIGIIGFVMYRKKSSMLKTPSTSQQMQIQTQQSEEKPQIQKESSTLPSESPEPLSESQEKTNPEIQTCPHCNTQIPINFSICNSCGKQINN